MTLNKYMIRELFQTDADLVSSFLRVVAGIIIFPYGMQKIFGRFGGQGIGGTIEQMRLRKLPVFIAWLVIIGQSLVSQGCLL